MKKQVLARNLRQYGSFVWYGDDETLSLEQFAYALNSLPYHYWVKVHEDVIDACQNLIMELDYEGRYMLTAEGEKNLDSLFGDKVYSKSCELEGRSDDDPIDTRDQQHWEEAEEYIW